MPVITKLLATIRQDGANLYLENQFVTTITIDTILHFHLKPGLEITFPELEDILIFSYRQKLFQQSVNYISIRLRSKKELYDYLVQRLYKLKNQRKHSNLFINIVEKNHDTLINQTIATLVEKQYIDDYAFAKAWVKSRVNSKPRGLKLLQIELQSKGVDAQITHQALSDLKVNNQATQCQMLNTILIKNLRVLRYKNYPPEKLKQVLINRLLSKGFSYQQITAEIDEFLIKEYNNFHKTE